MTSANNKFADLAQRVKKSVLLTCSVDVGLETVYLEFAAYDGVVDVKVRFTRVLVLDLFKEADDAESFFILTAKSDVIESDTDDLFRSLRGRSDHLHQILTRITERPLYHLYLEGDINLDLVAIDCELLS